MRICQVCCMNLIDDSVTEEAKICDSSLDKSLFRDKCKSCIRDSLTSCDIYESIVEHQAMDRNIDAL